MIVGMSDAIQYLRNGRFWHEIANARRIVDICCDGYCNRHYPMVLTTHCTLRIRSGSVIFVTLESMDLDSSSGCVENMRHVVGFRQIRHYMIRNLVKRKELACGWRI